MYCTTLVSHVFAETSEEETEMCELVNLKSKVAWMKGHNLAFHGSLEGLTANLHSHKLVH